MKSVQLNMTLNAGFIISGSSKFFPHVKSSFGDGEVGAPGHNSLIFHLF